MSIEFTKKIIGILDLWFCSIFA